MTVDLTLPDSEPFLYRFAGVEVDPARASVTRDGAKVPLRPKTYRLLIFLLDRPDRLVTKEELIEGVWDGMAVSDDVLVRSIAELRKAFGDDSKSQQVLRTYPKLGYGLVMPVQVVSTAAAGETTPIAAIAAPRRNVWIGIAAAAIVLAAAGWMYIGLARPGLPSLPDGEVAWWRFDEGRGSRVADSAGRSPGRIVAGQPGNSAPQWVQGRHGTALSFDGGGHVEGELTARGLLSSTLAAWIKVAAPPSHPIPLFEAPGMVLWVGPGWHVSVGRKNAGFGVTRPLADQSWHHVVFVNEGPMTNAGRAFIDGREEASSLLARQAAAADSAKWRLGSGQAGSGGFRGSVDDVRIYGRPLNGYEIEGLYRCGKEEPDLSTPGQPPLYFLPIRGGARIAPQAIENPGMDVGGIQFARSDGVCGVESLRGADLGQDLRIAAELLVPGDATHRTEAGPYLRSKRAYAGDGIAGGTSSGYLALLNSLGGVAVWQLNPYHILAESAAPEGFDPARFHRMEVIARGAVLEISLDGAPLEFGQNGSRTRQVQIAATETGRGTAGIAFAALTNRGSAGGQAARNLEVQRLGK